jgi:hypothetical protein
LLLEGCVSHPEILRLALPYITRSPDDPWWAGKLDEAGGSGELVCLRILLEHCNVAKCAPTILHQIVGSAEDNAQSRLKCSSMPLHGWTCATSGTKARH